MGTNNDGWQKVVFASELPECPQCDEPICEHEKHYAECNICIGPTEEDVEYKEIGDELYGRRLDPNVTSVCEKLRSRSARGLQKYGVNTTRTDIDLIGWLQHLQEELLDASIYVERLMQEFRELHSLGSQEPPTKLVQISKRNLAAIGLLMNEFSKAKPETQGFDQSDASSRGKESDDEEQHRENEPPTQNLDEN